MNSQQTQSKTVRDQLLAAMRSGEFAGCDRLPRESVLAEHLGISRTQLRDILSLLEREGFISRLHGVGTVINHHVLDARTRADIEIEFLDMIRQNGYEAEVAFVRFSEETAGKKIAKRLQIPEGTPVIRIARLCTADGRPAIYCEDVIEKALAHGEYTLRDLEQPIFHFLKQFCSVVPYMDLTDVRAVVADARLAEIFQIPTGSPLLNMDEVDYDVNGKPVFCSDEYFADGIFRHTIMRKKL